MDLEGIMLSEINETKRKTNTVLSYMWNLKKEFSNRVHRYREQIGELPEAGVGGWVKWVKEVKRDRFSVLK